MSSGGFVAEEEIFELRERVLTLEKYFAELAKWTYFIPLKNIPKSYGVASPVAKVDGVTGSENSVGYGNEEFSQNNGNEEGYFEQSYESMTEYNYYDYQRNPQGTSDEDEDETSPQPPKEADYSMELEDCDEVEVIEDFSTASGGSVDVDDDVAVDSGLKDEGSPQQMKTADKTFYISAEEDHHHHCDSSDEDNVSIGKDFSESAKAARKRSPKKKSTTTTSAESSPPVNQGKVAVKPQLKCPHCPKAFNLRYTLMLHIRSHTGERPFPCPHCPHATSQAGHLRLHIQKTHGKGNGNFICCTVCGLKFPSQATLMAHRKNHFSCPHCLHFTTNQHQLKDHILKNHLNEKQPLNSNTRLSPEGVWRKTDTNS